MSDYYQFLEVAPTAPMTEVEAAIANKYNKWRRLVTHHDPEIAEEASRALRQLEQARTTLTDPEQRAVYDQSLRSGGLADPTRQPQSLPTPPPPRKPPAAQSARVETHRDDRVDAWVCEKCETPNQVGLLYCKQCGNQIGRECPNCGNLIEARAPVCSHCGVRFEEALQIVQKDYVLQLRQDIEAHRNEIRRIEQRRGFLGNVIGQLDLRTSWPFIVGGYVVLFLLSAVVEDGACLTPLLCLTVLTGIFLFTGYQRSSQAIGEINAHQRQIDELEGLIKSIKAGGGG